jgi:hypothetical protein
MKKEKTKETQSTHRYSSLCSICSSSRVVASNVSVLCWLHVFIFGSANLLAMGVSKCEVVVNLFLSIMVNARGAYSLRLVKEAAESSIILLQDVVA